MASNPPTKDTKEEKKLARNGGKQTTKEKNDSFSAHIGALINAYTRERETDREENRRENRRKSFREWITISLLVMAFGAAVVSAVIFNWQLAEMRSTGGQTNTLIETNKKLAEAASQSAKIAETSMRKTQRAAFAITQKMTGFEKGGTPTGSIFAANVGNTSGYSVSLKTYIDIVTYPIPSVVVFSEKIEHPATASVVTKNEAIGGVIALKRALTDAEFESIEKGVNRRLVVRAILEFRDAFDCKIRRDVCYLYDGKAARGGDPQLCRDGRNDEKYEGEC